MALKTVSQLRDSVAGILSGIDLNNVDNVNGCFERGVRVLIQNADVPEASSKQNITLYAGVTDYECDERIFASAVTDLRPQGVSRQPSDVVYKRDGEQFDRTKGYLPNGTMVTFEYDNGTPIIRVVSVVPTPQNKIDPMSSTDGWVAAGSASNLVEDGTVYYQYPASLRFLLTGAGTGTLTKTLNSAIDVSDYEDVGVAFLALRIPDGATSTNLTGITLKLGSDSGNYNSVSETEGFLGAWISGNWLLVAFDFSLASQTGTPDWGSLDYVQVSFDHSATFTNIRVGGLWLSLPSPSELLFQTAAVFKASGQQPSTTITSNADEIILNDAAFTLLEYECSICILESTGGASVDSSIRGLQNKLSGNGVNDFGLYGKYRGDNPSQEIRTTGSWY